MNIRAAVGQNRRGAVRQSVMKVFDVQKRLRSGS